MKFIPLLVAFYVAFVHSVSDSDPNYVTVCDAFSERFGCDPKFWYKGDRTQCLNTTQLMSWTSKPVRTNCFQLSAGDETNPVTSYIPGELLMINIRVTCYKYWYRGIMLYAVDENGVKVGDWELTTEVPPVFKRPWTSPEHQCFGTLMHANAQLKPYHAITYFRAPAVGTKRITFRTLIKYGNANTGAFYWPEVDLSLDEAAVPTDVVQYEMTEAGQSCSEYCLASNKHCNKEAIEAIADSETLYTEISGSKICSLPLLETCSNLVGAYDSANQYCYYQSAGCNVTSISACDTKTPGYSRFCSCSVVQEEEEDVSASTMNRGNSFFAISLLFPLLFATNGRLSFILLLLLGISSAHNWINSGSRSPWIASPNIPCKPARTDIPFAQVGPNQPFQIEWMNGHGDNTYFAIVHESDYEKLALHTPELLDDYIENAPAGNNKAFDPQYTRLSRKDTNTLDNDTPTSNTPNFFASFVDSKDSRYLDRPLSFQGEIGALQPPTAGDTVYLVAYKNSTLADAKDARVSYSSSKYPWIEAAFRYKNVIVHPHRPDVTKFYIPGTKGEGRYIVHFMWRGYRDCIDVDFKSTQVDKIYGDAPVAPSWKRIDHCLFENIRDVMDFSLVVTDHQYCLDACKSGKCVGVNLVPLEAPSTAYKFNAPDGSNWMYPNIYGTDIYTPWNFTVFNSTRDQFASVASPAKYMCYGVFPAVATDTIDEFTISNDPDDPIFYSTCYYKYAGNTFPEYESPEQDSTMAIPWKYQTKCIDCKDQAFNSHTAAMPVWTISEVCTNCDLSPENVTLPEPIPAIMIENGTRCDGLGGFSNILHHSCPDDQTASECTQQLIPLGRSAIDDVLLDECRTLAEMNPICSKYYYLRVGSPSKCYCYANTPCCKNCSRVAATLFTSYEMDSVPDPACANGVMSSDGSACCSASCTKCVNSVGAVDYIGWCSATGIKNSGRSCDKYGPPCAITIVP